MTNISKRALRPSYQKKLFRQLSSTLSQLNSREANIFLDELLGDEERVMLAKRFAAIVMLIEHATNYRIAQVLNMSESTVSALRVKYKHGEYEHIEKRLKCNKKAYRDFLKTLEIILRAGLPPIAGRGRWKYIFETFNKKP